MKAKVEEFLLNIDNSFKDKEQNEVYMTYVLIFGVIFAFSYLLLWEDSEKSFNKIKKNVVAVEKKISSDKLYMQQNPKIDIQRLNQAIQKAKNGAKSFKENNDYINEKIESIAELKYDKKAWGKYLHSISINAKENHIKILDFENSFGNTDSSFGHILNISLNVSSDYKNLLNFINSIEQSNLVVDLHSLDITYDVNNKLNAEFKISVWGITD